MALLALALLAVGAALVLAGDDGDGDETDVAVVDDPVAQVCRDSNAQIATAQRALLEGNESPEAVVGFFADAFVDLARDRAAAIRAVEPAPTDDVLAVVDEHDTVVDAIEADPGSAAGLSNPFAAVNERWRRLGLADCAIDSSTVREQ